MRLFQLFSKQVSRIQVLDKVEYTCHTKTYILFIAVYLIVNKLKQDKNKSYSTYFLSTYIFTKLLKILL